jgi:hypothetical protein
MRAGYSTGHLLMPGKQEARRADFNGVNMQEPGCGSEK